MVTISEMRDAWVSKRKSFRVASPSEPTVLHPKGHVKEAVQSGFITAVVAGAVVAVPTLVGCRVIPWAKANLNYTAQALIISSASVSSLLLIGVFWKVQEGILSKSWTKQHNEKAPDSELLLIYLLVFG